MSNHREWNRRDFILKPVLWAGAARVLGAQDLLLAESANEPAPGPILQRTLGKTGITLPVVSMGVMNADVPGVVRRAYEVGIRHFDTAAVYQNGRNEEMVARMGSDPRDRGCGRGTKHVALHFERQFLQPRLSFASTRG